MHLLLRRPDEENGLEDYPALRRMFDRYGQIVQIIPRIIRGANNSWCFITFTAPEAVQYAIRVATESPQLMRTPAPDDTGALLKVMATDTAVELERDKQQRAEQGALATVWQGALDAGSSGLSNIGFGGEREGEVQSGYSQLLQVACDYAQDSHSPILFESQVLQVIIAHKWNEKKWMYFTQFASFLVYLVGFSLIAMKFEDWRKSGEEPVRKAAWALWGYISFMTVLRTKYELSQFYNDYQDARGRSCGIRLWRASNSYLSDKWNWVDLISCGASALALAAVAVGQAASLVDDAATLATDKNDDAAAIPSELQEGVDPVLVKNILALGLLGCGFKLLYYLRGIETTAFLINMLDAIVSDISVIVFMLVLLVLLLTFAGAYYILLGDPANKGTEDENGFETYFRSFLTTFYMALGEVDAAVFFPSSSKKTVGFAAPFLLFFAFIITIVMLNALIAIMSDTYRSVQEVQVRMPS